MKKFLVIWPWLQAAMVLALLILNLVTKQVIYAQISSLLAVIFSISSLFHPTLDTKKIKKYYEEHRDEFK